MNRSAYQFIFILFYAIFTSIVVFVSKLLDVSIVVSPLRWVGFGILTWGVIGIIIKQSAFYLIPLVPGSTYYTYSKGNALLLNLWAIIVALAILTIGYNLVTVGPSTALTLIAAYLLITMLLFIAVSKRENSIWLKTKTLDFQTTFIMIYIIVSALTFYVLPTVYLDQYFLITLGLGILLWSIIGFATKRSARYHYVGGVGGGATLYFGKYSIFNNIWAATIGLTILVSSFGLFGQQAEVALVVIGYFIDFCIGIYFFRLKKTTDK